ncbi:MBL fold metallo-hydrolase [Candidatus Woesearchaeota archaeon]|nr:MBL fold metallo-hydrolase [Candidatus Woesearchaeota archaeon]
MKITWLSHDCFRIEAAGKIIYTDPFKIDVQEQKADIITVSHGHFDHMSKDDIKKVLKQETKIITSEEGAKALKCFSLKPGETQELDGIKITGVYAYNLNKFREPGKPFHPKGEGLGFVIEAEGRKLYHAGDSDAVPELKDHPVDIALVPVSGIYVMTAEEAVEAVRMMKPKHAIPMHFGEIVGSEADAYEFKRLVEEQTKTKVKVLAKGESAEF